LFTIEQINDVHERLGNMESLPDYLGALAALGVDRFDSYLCDGHTEYFSSDGQRIVSEAAHELLTIADITDRQEVAEHLARHERGETDYVEMSTGLAASGVQKWTMDTHDLTVTYLDNEGNALLVEALQKVRRAEP
jgi:uncharacterized protein YbcV (DUF1398 family)